MFCDAVIAAVLIYAKPYRVPGQYCNLGGHGSLTMDVSQQTNFLEAVNPQFTLDSRIRIPERTPVYIRLQTGQIKEFGSLKSLYTSISP